MPRPLSPSEYEFEFIWDFFLNFYLILEHSWLTWWALKKVTDMETVLCCSSGLSTFGYYWKPVPHKYQAVLVLGGWQVSYTSTCIYSFSFFKINYFNWRLITLQYCGGFCHTSAWMSHGWTCVPHPEPLSCLPPHPIPQGYPRAPALGALPHASNLHWSSILHIYPGILVACFRMV